VEYNNVLNAAKELDVMHSTDVTLFTLSVLLKFHLQFTVCVVKHLLFGYSCLVWRAHFVHVYIYL